MHPATKIVVGLSLVTAGAAVPLGVMLA